MNHSPVPQMKNLCYLRHTWTQQELERRQKQHRSGKLFSGFVNLHTFGKSPFLSEAQHCTVCLGLYLHSYKTISRCRDIISTEKTDISNHISTTGKITSPLLCSPPLTSTVSYYCFSVFRALLCFHLFHPISGSEGISSTLGMCYILSSPTSITRWKIFV